MDIQQKVTKGEWEAEFSGGKWNGLDSSPLERARHAIIGMFINHISPKGKILDVGCGLGTTTDFLNLPQKTEYLGIDISEAAVKIASEEKDAEFKVSEFLSLPADQSYDVIVFNEVLYYLDEEASLQHARKLLNENGYIIISLYRQRRMHYSDKSIWNLSRKYFNPIDDIELSGIVEDGRRVTWRIEVLGAENSTGWKTVKPGRKSGGLLKRFNIALKSFNPKLLFALIITYFH